MLPTLPTYIINIILKYACPFSNQELIQQKHNLKPLKFMLLEFENGNNSFNVFNDFHYDVSIYCNFFDHVLETNQYIYARKPYFSNWENTVARFLHLDSISERIVKDNGIRIYKTNQNRSELNFKKTFYPFLLKL